MISIPIFKRRFSLTNFSPIFMFGIFFFVFPYFFLLVIGSRIMMNQYVKVPQTSAREPILAVHRHSSELYNYALE
jgi:polyferredoxin